MHWGWKKMAKYESGTNEYLLWAREGVWLTCWHLGLQHNVQKQNFKEIIGTWGLWLWPWRAPDLWQSFLKCHYLMTDVFHRFKLSLNTIWFQLKFEQGSNYSCLAKGSIMWGRDLVFPFCSLRSLWDCFLICQRKIKASLSYSWECVYMHAHVCTRIWRLEVSSSSSLHLIFWYKIFTEPRIHWFDQNDWPVNPSNPPVSVSWGLGSQAQDITYSFFFLT